MRMRDTRFCPRQLRASARLSGSVPQQAEQERSEQKEKLQWEDKGAFLTQVHFKTVVPNFACSITHTSFRGVVPSMHWLSGVILGVLTTRWQLWSATGDYSKHFSNYIFLLLHNKNKKKKRQEKKSRKSRGKNILTEVPLVEVTVFPQAEDYVSFSWCTHAGLKALASPVLLGRAASLDPATTVLQKRLLWRHL